MIWHDGASTALGATTDLSVAAGLLAAVPPGPAEMERHRRRVLDALAARADLAQRTARPGHLTGSALVVSDDGDRVLLLLHRKLGRWLQPGGHADGEANLARVAWRESTEETGIGGLRLLLPALDVDIHRVDPPGEDPHLHYDLRFVVVAPPAAVAQGNHESRALKWVRWEDLHATGADVGLVRLGHRAREVTRRREWRSRASG